MVYISIKYFNYIIIIIIIIIINFLFDLISVLSYAVLYCIK